MKDSTNQNPSSMMAQIDPQLANLTDQDLAAMSPSQKALLAEQIAKEVRYKNDRRQLNLSDQKNLDLLTNVVIQLVRFYDPPTAKKFVRKMEQRIIEYGDSLNQNFLVAYRSLVLRTKFLSLDLLDDDEVKDLLQNHLVEYLFLPIPHVNIIDELDKSFIRFVWPPDIETFARGLLDGLQQNLETLGEANLQISTNGRTVSVRPLISNWLKDYTSFQSHLKNVAVNAQDSNNTFGRVGYINKVVSQYKLSESQKEILLKVFEVFDWLKYGWAEQYERDSKPQATSGEMNDIVSELNSGVAKLPDIPSNELNPLIPAPKNFKPQRPIQEVRPAPTQPQSGVVKAPLSIREQLQKQPPVQIPNNKISPLPAKTEEYSPRPPTMYTLGKSAGGPVNIQDILQSRAEQGSSSGLNIASGQVSNNRAQPNSEAVLPKAVASAPMPVKPPTAVPAAPAKPATPPPISPPAAVKPETQPAQTAVLKSSAASFGMAKANKSLDADIDLRSAKFGMQSKQSEIDRKLQELEKRLKN